MKHEELDITKLPKWAQQYIKGILLERKTAIRALNEYVDSQTPSAFYIDEMESTGEEQGPSVKRRYIQGQRMQITHAGITVDIILRDTTIDLQWDEENRHGDVAMIPSSYMAMRLVAKKNMSG